MIQISDNNLGETGFYSIGLEGITPISSGNVNLPLKTTTGGSISNQIEKDQLTFSANRGDIIQLVLKSRPRDSGFFAVAELFAPSGVREKVFTANSGVVTIEIQESGRHMIQVADSNLSKRGFYTLRRI